MAFKVFLILVSIVKILLLFKNVISYPINKTEFGDKPEVRDEKYYPNGTVVGKYSYTDKAGNPIQVKYFADDSSYGVELKSVRIIGSSSVKSPKLDKLNYLTKTTDAPIIQPYKIVPGLLNENYFAMRDKYKEKDKLKFFNGAKVNHINLDKKNPDYDVYYKNELKGPNMCEKENVRIYLEKQKRKTRNVLNDYVMPKFCEMI